MSERIRGGAVLVTGASSGIGLETSVHLAERGFRVYPSMRDLDRQGALLEELGRRRASAEVLEVDVTDPVSVRRAVDHILAREGAIHGVVSNAGINIGGFFEELSDEEMRQVLEVNLLGTIAVCREVVPHMREARRGRIVIMSSIAGKIPSLGAISYCTSKFALEGFGETLAQEMSPFGVHVSLVAPGAVKTELFARNRRQARRAAIPGSPYHAWNQRIEAMLEDLGDHPATTLGDVAGAVERALTESKPDLRYVVGRRPKLLLALRRYLPGDLFRRIWTREAVRRVTAAKV